MAAVALGCLAVGGGVAYAVIPNASGVINGCYERRTGLLRVVDGEACRKAESAIHWNQVGPPGARGPQGERGLQGEKGEEGPPGVVGSLDQLHGVPCMGGAGKKIGRASCRESV